MQGDDGVVLDVIQITDDQVPNGQHLRVQHTYGTDDVSSILIQQGREERLREMAPAAARRRGVDGAAVLRQSFAKHYGGGGGVGEGEGGNQRPGRSGMKSLLSPHYI